MGGARPAAALVAACALLRALHLVSSSSSSMDGILKCTEATTESINAHCDESMKGKLVEVMSERNPEEKFTRMMCDAEQECADAIFQLLACSNPESTHVLHTVARGGLCPGEECKANEEGGLDNCPQMEFKVSEDTGEPSHVHVPAPPPRCFGSPSNWEPFEADDGRWAGHHEEEVGFDEVEEEEEIRGGALGWQAARVHVCREAQGGGDR
eukprot:CAMPEP_0182888298 /NCGR_PEP_ID=MMETSP0034_2-20130328/21347_1 /TAXON_ID=156128 /ORGANISM="Nephroselmis pyriformis, Strain CCMP717" /LENGTH=210 /DNA_ID=CAMNT_0025021719 /DNA_START=85 /DNA_END=715 /DNA_ORIENTATION=+